MYEGSICICCMATDNLTELFSTINKDGSNENYAEMLKSCFDIKISETDGHSFICENCVEQLQNSVKFKQQVLINISMLTDKQIANKGQEVIDCDTGSDTSQDPSDEKVDVIKIQGVASNEEIPYKVGNQETCCKECGQHYANNTALMNHYNSSHLKSYKCDCCMKIFLDRSSLDQHRAMHLNKCENCEKSFATTAMLQAHVLTHHPMPHAARMRLETHAVARGNTDLACKYCAKRFSNAAKLELHVERSHEMVLYACPLCDYKSKKQYLKLHLTNKHQFGSKLYKCQYCSKTFATKKDRTQHEKIHLGDRRFICRVCTRTFVHKTSLKSHVGMHIRKKEFSGEAKELLDAGAVNSDDDLNEQDAAKGVAEEEEGSMVEEFLLEDDDL